MYKMDDKRQLDLENFYLPFGGHLNPGNRWVRLAKLIPWAELEEKYSQNFCEDNGAPAKPFRMALGSLLIKEKLDITDRETVEQIKENHYLQYLIGMESYSDEAPFDASLMVHFRKRITDEIINEINELIHRNSIKKNEKADEKTESENKETEKVNKGKLLIDSTCVPSDIRYPTDLSLLNEAREKTEKIIDILHEPYKGKKKKVRTYRNKARKDYLKVSKKRKPKEKLIRWGIKKQLGYIGRNLLHIKHLQGKRKPETLLSKTLYNKLQVIKELYVQQEEMYRLKSHKVSDRIVSISQSHVRPIVRGKERVNVEFGAKISVSQADGYVFLDKISWDAYNEGNDLEEQVENYFRRFGYYPESVHGDRIYRSRENRNYCNEKNIRLSGLSPGRPPKDKEKYRSMIKEAREDEKDRIPIEGSFGNAKRRYGLSLIKAKLKETGGSSISLKILVLNLDRLSRKLFFVTIEIRVYEDDINQYYLNAA